MDKHRSTPPLEISTHQNPATVKSGVPLRVGTGAEVRERQSGADYMRSLRNRSDLDGFAPQTQEQQEQEQREGAIVVGGIALALVVGVATIMAYSANENSKATEKGVETRAKLLAALPEGTTLPPEIQKELNCIILWATKRCEGIVGTDDFVRKNCDEGRLQEAANNGQNPIEGLQTRAKTLLNPQGLDPDLMCEGLTKDEKFLNVTVHKVPSATEIRRSTKPTRIETMRPRMQGPTRPPSKTAFIPRKSGTRSK